jgi:hypothetical protein
MVVGVANPKVKNVVTKSASTRTRLVANVQFGLSLNLGRKTQPPENPLGNRKSELLTLMKG